MAVIIVGTDDAHSVSILSETLASMGHSPLALSTTENIVEDVVLNDAALVLLAPELVPYSGWDACELLRGDPTVPRDLSVLMLTAGKGDVRRLEKCGFDGVLDPQVSAGELAEEFTRQLGERAATD